MTTNDLKEKYVMLYDYMATSDNPAYMKTFGRVMSDMMEWMIANKTEAAQEYIERLCAIKWNNYLTQKEAEVIVAKMNPKAPWNKDAWKSVIDSLGMVAEEEPYYNSCALWATMNMVYSDSANTIATLLEAPLAEIPQQQMFKACHALALDKLKDADGVFSIRNYFGV